MTEKELVTDILDEMTFSNALPFNIPLKEIRRIVKIASNYFYDNWIYATQTAYMLLPQALFRDKVFAQNRLIKMPDCVRFVHHVKEITGGSVFGTIDRDFSEQKFLGSEVFLTPFMGESIMYRIAVFSFLDLTKNLMIDTIAYDYNKNNKQLHIDGRTPKCDVVVIAAKAIELESMYDDEVFQRYVRAKAKMRLGEMLTTFDFNLPGNVKLNYGTIVEAAKEEMQQIQDQLKSENTPCFLIFERY